MLRDKIIRAWKDPEYRQSLSEEERELLPENPAGAIELTDEELDMAAGGSWRQSYSQSYRPSNSQSYRPSNSQSYRPSNSRPSNSQSWSNRPSQSYRPSNSRSYSNSNSYSYRHR
jgi:mersacidin/lichenicidin family type 2 lantibiotic